jgi:hypothetical protein
MYLMDVLSVITSQCYSPLSNSVQYCQRMFVALNLLHSLKNPLFHILSLGSPLHCKKTNLITQPTVAAPLQAT